MLLYIMHVISYINIYMYIYVYINHRDREKWNLVQFRRVDLTP